MKKYVPLLMALMLWSLPTIFMKILSADFDFITQSFYRYMAAGIFSLVFVYVFEKKAFFKGLRHYRFFIFPSIILVIAQMMLVKGVELTNATISLLLTKLSVIFIIFFSFFMFRDERKIIKSRTFIVALFLSLIGVFGVAMRDSVGPGKFGSGVMVLVFFSVFSGLYATYIKRLVRRIDPFVSTAFVVAFATLWLFFLTILFGNLGKIGEVSASTNFILFSSGLVCIAIGDMFNYESVKFFGTSKAYTFLLLTPLLTGILSYFLLAEVLTTLQIISGLVLMGGATLLIHPRIHIHHGH